MDLMNLAQALDYTSPATFMNRMEGNELKNQRSLADINYRNQEVTGLGLDNLFKQDNNPLKLEEQRLQNTGLGITNESNNIKLTQDRALAPVRTEAERTKLITQKSDDEMKQMFTAGQRMALSDDPVEAQKGQSILQKHNDFIKIREQHKNAMDLAKFNRDSAEKIAAGNNATTLGAARISADARLAAGGARKAAGDFWTSFYKATTARNRYALLNSEAAKIEQEDPEEAARLKAMAAAIEPQVQAEIAAGPKPGAVNAGAVTGLPTNPTPSVAPPNIAPRQPQPQIPPGATKIGTSGGKPVYVMPDGRKFILQ
jgi:hypothetical protein